MNNLAFLSLLDFEVNEEVRVANFSMHSVCRIEEIYKITLVKNRRAVWESNRTLSENQSEVLYIE
jgi:hypothetical protein